MIVTVIVFKGLPLHSETETLSKDTNASNPQVALLFLSKRELHHEAVWRAFFEAAGVCVFSKYMRHPSIGRLRFRYQPPDRPYESFVYGDGKELFAKINEVICESHPLHLPDMSDSGSQRDDCVRQRASRILWLVIMNRLT